MRKLLMVVFYFIVLLSHSTVMGADVYINSPAQIFFSPNGGCTEAIIKKVDAAKTEVLVAAYSFSSVPIGTALINAKKRGVKVEVVADSSNLSQAYSLKDMMVSAGIPIFMDNSHSIMHNKFLVIDDMYVITGSFNYSASAEACNGENIIILKSSQTSSIYKQNWNVHKAHSVEYKQ